MIEFLAGLPIGLRIIVVIILAVLAHLVVMLLKRASERVLIPSGISRAIFNRRFPKVSTVTTIVAGAITFVIYFSALGIILAELGVRLTTYFASASVIGLAIAFGSQGLVQDVVIGLTLIFSDVIEVDDMIDVGGQTGRVERIGLRFTVLVNLLDQHIYIPNRNIGQVGRYRNGYVRAYVDIQLPPGMEASDMAEVVRPIADGMHDQYGAIVLTEPELMGVFRAEPGAWKYLRIKFRLWPGQGDLIETTFKQRILAALREHQPSYADWMITVFYRVK